MAVRTNGSRITREDLEAAYTRVLGEGEASAQAAAPPAIAIAGAIVIGVIAIAYLAGRRRGRRRSAILEIRRV